MIRWVVIGVIGAYLIAVFRRLWSPPPRYRRHGLGRIQEAADHRFGIFWNSYPEDGGVEGPHPTPDRNDPCPCGSGRKHKRCCGGT